MINKLSSEVLCAHVHDTMCDHGISQRNIDAFVSTIYGCDRTIQMCKEIASLAKSVIANSDIDYATFNHIPFKRRHGEVVCDSDGLPILVGAGFECLNTLIHLPQSDTRDQSLILLTKLHGYVQPLRVGDAVKRTPDMFRNIMSERPNIPYDFQQSYRRLVRQFLERNKFVQEYDWREHILPLHTLATIYHGSGKKKPCIVANYDGEVYFDNAQEANQLQAYTLPFILMGEDQRDLYLSNKEEYLTLVMGETITRVKDDSSLLKYPVVDYHVGRIGIRMQEAEKVRTLWMPKVVYEALTNPIVEILEGLVHKSKHQTTYLNDSDAALMMREAFFGIGDNAGPSDVMIYSIDQSSFTDKFPYRNLQRIILEELCDMGKVPQTSLRAFDVMVEGAYQPSNAYTKRKVWTEDVIFSCGTPMGDPGAFMLATLAHEFVIELIQRKYRVHTPYFVQGDDATLQGSQVYKDYCDTMSMLGCSINESKTMQSYRAIEYCGFISTPTISVPMYRPHDRYHDDPKDVVSPRAIEAFGEDTLVSWIEANRPEILLPLGVMGYLPNTSFPDTDKYILMQDVCKALSSGSKLLQPGESKEQMDIYYGIRSYYPEVEADDSDIRTTAMRRSDYSMYAYLMSSLQRHMKCLKTDPEANLEREASVITGICSVLETGYKDRIPILHPPKGEEEDERESRNPYKPKAGNPDVTLNTAKRAIQLIESHSKACLEERSESYNDDNNLPEL